METLLSKHGFPKQKSENLKEEEGGNITTYKFFGVDLTYKQRIGNHNAFVSERRSFETIRLEVVQSHINSLND